MPIIGGDNNYEQAHNQGEKRQKDTGTAVLRTAVDLGVDFNLSKKLN